ncbi:hypothetical protein SAMN05216282_101102 [Cryobacterium psychrotolerans]|uniref:Uncharacterized protein n=1 Tax=Cryobacterium psychrotolerans TaxID=386301 RepID=A0A1G8X6M9_9MICO|nr:hypothetical protein [Cryobacterium psychrotolerans]TFD83016.1 hypothetical protein E3T56_14895 [Cryobacterium psychrotolerans]SDJ86074.1 hypothetical protein SAMN05216282_101102 [Cryobacterium psychrotolerans]
MLGGDAGRGLALVAEAARGSGAGEIFPGYLASRTGMKELMVRSPLHAEALGDESAGQAARLLGAEIDNPALADLLSR